MKVFAISDFHISVEDEKPMDIFGTSWANYLDEIRQDWNQKVVDDDVVLVCGDLSWAMKIEEIDKACEYLNSLTGKKIIIRGNHDYWWKSISCVRKALPQNCFALQNDSIKIGGYVFCGTRGWLSEENKPLLPDDEKINSREALRLEMALVDGKKKMVEGDKLVVLLHYPPFNSKQESSKFTELCEKFDVDSVVYGHLHGKNVNKKLLYVKNGVKYYLTSCDQVGNKIVKIYDEEIKI